VLDLFCCAGGAGMGYWQAGFEVTGVDITPSASYPFRLLEGDALDAFAEMCQDVDLVHASPPCQANAGPTRGTNAARNRAAGRRYVDLIPQVRQVAQWYGVPYVIENVPGADMRRDLTLCGEMFGLAVLRHRHFEIGGHLTIARPEHRPHRGYVRGWRHGVYRDGPYIAAYGKGGAKGTVPEMQAAMGITWTDRHEELTEAIPPAYTRYIGRAFIADDWGAVYEPDPARRLANLDRAPDAGRVRA
jgi:DNA (cytosine-5)-methyltransferase 1